MVNILASCFQKVLPAEAKPGCKNSNLDVGKAMDERMGLYSCQSLTGCRDPGGLPPLQISEFEFATFPSKFLTPRDAVDCRTTVIGKGPCECDCLI